MISDYMKNSLTDKHHCTMRQISKKYLTNNITVLPAKSDSGVRFCIQLLSKILTCTHHMS